MDNITNYENDNQNSLNNIQNLKEKDNYKNH
jgi:hypothetical protein